MDTAYAQSGERGRTAAAGARDRVWWRLRWVTTRRAVAAIVLVLGMLSVPVNCALAIGPHSLFIPAEAIAAQQHAAHAHHLVDIVPDLGLADRVCDPRAEVAPGNQGPVADRLPTPATALTVLVAVTSDDAIAQLPFMEAVLPTEQAAPSACHARLEVPPPRSGL